MGNSLSRDFGLSVWRVSRWAADEDFVRSFGI